MAWRLLAAPNHYSQRTQCTWGIGNRPAHFCDAWFKRSTQGDGIALANNPDELVLTRPDGVEIDWLHYTNAWWVAGASIGIDPGVLDSGANDDVSHWCVQTTVMTSGGEPGTPGVETDPCS